MSCPSHMTDILIFDGIGRIISHSITRRPSDLGCCVWSRVQGHHAPSGRAQCTAVCSPNNSPIIITYRC
jgi:hypothetical protein